MKYLIFLIIIFSSCQNDSKRLETNYQYQGLVFGNKILHIIAKQFNL